MINQEKFHKLCKYSIRLNKSFILKNSKDYAKYCSHLKYHIGEQIGNGSNPELDKLFDILTKYIDENKDTYNISNIKEKFNLEIEEKNNELEQVKKKLEDVNSTDNIKNKLEYLKKNNIGEFIKLLEELFTKLYDENTSTAISEILKKNILQTFMKNRLIE